ncbi:protein kinase domain-containing protein [Desulfatibacillum aliphaticivorans]|uniref:protein kinase domain-containing protein n=1 Tax=Desulfatibacillum aliphaticivorans TaxID=218208 RepID=UPI0003FEA6A0|nr:protein kinase [Desulfatibacillum aliphaticivorans]
MTEKIEPPNCWEYTQCGKEPGGANVDENGPCQAALKTALDGVNNGKNAGRLCWAVDGTMCHNQTPGPEEDKISSCISCPFFQKVQEAEDQGDLRTKFLRFVTMDGKKPLMQGLEIKHVAQGERFIIQNANSEAGYIIQKGSCRILVEKDGELVAIGRRGLGEVVGVTALLTGAPYSAHVEAETPMCLWVIRRDQFEAMVEKDRDLMEFLTELVADRLSADRPMADRAVGRYTAREVLGKGGFSMVYKGIHTALEMPVAIKMLHHDKALDPDFLAAFRNEAESIAKFNHENIVRVFDIEELYRTVFIIMEYLEGELLSDMIKRLGRLSPLLAADFMVQACRGLEYAHKFGIIHRDINVSNLFIQTGDRLKIMDFGIACKIGTEDFGETGTAAFMSPEQIDGDPVDERTDIYSLGLAAYEMVTGERAFPGNDIMALLDGHLERDVPDPAEKAPDLPPALRQVIMKAGKRAPDERFNKAGEIIEALTEILPQCDLPLECAPPVRKMTSLFLIYEEDKQKEVGRLTEEFSSAMKKLGVTLKAANFPDI